MDWTQTFYRKQAEWSTVYQGPVTEGHRARARRVSARIGSPPKRVLELGAGGGQDAVALAALGYEVVAVEREPRVAAHARALAAAAPALQVTVVEDDFYRVALPAGAFDAVVYWDGFGIGTDADQRRLLRRVRRWLKPAGWVFLEVYTPWHAARVAGYSTRVGEAVRTYGFDPEGCRWLDEWRRGSERVVQSLRCYSPADLRLLLEGTGLTWVELEPGGRLDPTTGRYEPRAPLAQAMSYTAILRIVN